MKNFNLYITAFVLLLVPFFAQAQNGIKNTIPFKHDTLFLGKQDSIIYQTGNSEAGEVKYKSGDLSFLVLVEGGFVTRQTTYFPDSQLKHETNFRNKKLDGADIEWNNNGLVIYSGHYKNGYADSVWTWYYNDGIKETQGAFLYDTSHLVPGFEINFRYEEDSAYTLTTKYDKQSPPDGNWSFYNLVGQKVKTLVFDKGVLKSIEVGSDSYSEDYFHKLIKQNMLLKEEIKQLKKEINPRR